ncbi:expressed unknown protein [Seminavis robusta]|uniref:PDZ domain-containing protein n=1 Tax=Seminavis robusta TaxID=568900 RepID=A0A9N8EBB5_9STRA|nr:expressed unknown protein [Seminavis robusta]|eukprot:Sro874_g214220.1 n/a (325) ;mRNA; r:22858-23832
MIFRKRRTIQQQKPLEDRQGAAMREQIGNKTCHAIVGEEEIPTILLKAELAIQPLDMFAATVSTNHCDTNTCKSVADGNDLVPLAPGEVQSSSNDCIGKYSHLPVLTAVNVDSFSAVSSQTVLYGYHDENKSKKRRRAAFLSATVVKPSTESKLGMGLKKGKDGSLQVSSLSNNQECLLSEAPFQTGDVLVSINNQSCTGMNLSAVGKLLKQTTGVLTVVVQNSTGDPTLVESMIRKPTPTSKTGLGVAQAAGQQIKVSSINPKGPFAESLLSRRDTILSVNDVPCECLMGATEAANIIVSAETSVTVVAQRQSDNAAVVAMAA